MSYTSRLSVSFAVFFIHRTIYIYLLSSVQVCPVIFVIFFGDGSIPGRSGYSYTHTSINYIPVEYQVCTYPCLANRGIFVL